MSQKLFPVIVGSARIRDAHNSGSFFDLECATNVKTALNTSENVKELQCGKGDSLTLEKPTGSITLKVIKTKNPDLLGKLLDLIVDSVVAGTNTITDESNTFDSNDKIEMLQRSNDGNGITSLVVKSNDGGTTYTLDTDYSVSVVNNKTTITRLSGGSIPAEASVLISGSIKQNAYKETEINLVQRVKKQFSIELFGEDEKTRKLTTLYANKVTLDSEYLLEMIDTFRDGDINGSDLTFKVADWGKVTFRDENID